MSTWGGGRSAGQLVVGHRGVAGHAPENTLEGFRRAAALGVSWVEFDVRLSADGHCVLLHDDSLDRTTDGHGPAAALTLAELQRLDAGSWFGPAFKGAHVPTLEETLAVLDELRLGAVVEIKPGPGAAVATGSAVASVLASHWSQRQPRPLLTSFETTALAAARDVAPDQRRALLVDAVPADWADRLAAVGAEMLHADQRYLDAAACEQVTVPLWAYTVNDCARAATLAGWGVEGLFSDWPDRIAREI